MRLVIISVIALFMALPAHAYKVESITMLCRVRTHTKRWAVVTDTRGRLHKVSCKKALKLFEKYDGYMLKKIDEQIGVPNS